METAIHYSRDYQLCRKLSIGVCKHGFYFVYVLSCLCGCYLLLRFLFSFVFIAAFAAPRDALESVVITKSEQKNRNSAFLIRVVSFSERLDGWNVKDSDSCIACAIFENPNPTYASSSRATLFWFFETARAGNDINS